MSMNTIYNSIDNSIHTAFNPSYSSNRNSRTVQGLNSANLAVTETAHPSTYLQTFYVRLISSTLFRHRLLAVFLFVLMLGSALIPPASAYASSTFDPRVVQTQNYPGPQDNTPVPQPKSLPGFLLKSTAVTAADQTKPNPWALVPKPTDHGQPRPGSKTASRHRKQLLGEGRSAHDKVFLNDDGTRTLEHSFAPGSYQDSSGTWQDIDMSLEDNAARDRLQTKANSWQASFGKNSVAQGISLSKDGQTFSFT